MARTSIKFSFKNRDGDTLAGIIDRPEETPAFWGVFAPCFTCIKESHGAAKICREMADRGAAMLRFDMTGLGQSTGSFFDHDFTHRVDDILSACAALAESFSPPALLVGHSISGTAALVAAGRMPGLKAVATVGSPADTQSVIEKFRRQGTMVETPEKINIDVLGIPFDFNPRFLGNMLSQDVAAATAALAVPLLVFHAPNDAIVSFDNAEKIMARATGDKTLFPLDAEATHLFENRRDDAAFVAETLYNRVRDEGRRRADGAGSAGA